MNKVKIMIDNIPYFSKPEDEEMSHIKTRFMEANTIKEVTIKELFDFIEKGHTFTPAILNAGIKKEHWLQQEIVAIDVDNKVAGIDLITPEEVIELLRENEIHITGYYHTFNTSVEHNRFRLIFRLSEPIRDPKKMKYILDTLYNFIPQADMGSCDLTQSYYGTDNAVVIINEEATITLEDIDKIYHLNQINQYNWETPLPLESVQVVSDFPVDCLPLVLRNYVVAVSENTATAFDMSALATLSVVATTLQGKYEVMGKDGWIEPLNIYTLVIAKPAERKSGVLKKSTKVLYQYEKSINEELYVKIEDENINLRIKTKQKAKAEKEENFEEARKISTEIMELEKNKTKLIRILADDVTPESLTSLLADNKGRLSIISAEGGVFDTLAGRYSSTVSIDTVLKAHIGDNIIVDRKGRDKEYINNPTLTMFLAVQDTVLEGVMSNSDFRGRGLTGRFLYCYPTSKLGTRTLNTPAIPPLVIANYEMLVRSLLEDKKDNEEPITLTLSAEAYRLLDDFFNWLEPQLVNELENMTDWAGKLAGTSLRIAGILHCVEYNSIQINETTMENAITIAKYLIDHAKMVYQLMGAEKEIQQAKFILKKLFTQDKQSLKRHEIFRLCRSARIKKVEDIDQSISLLIEYGYLKEKLREVTLGVGRKPDVEYQLNPIHFK